MPPGSFGLPLLGETLDYVRDPHRFFEDRVRRHGPVFKTHLLGKPTVVLTGPAAFSFFVTQPYFARHEANPASVRNLLGDCMPFRDGVEHGRRKYIVLAALDVGTIDRLLKILQEEVQRAAGRWSQQRVTVLLPELKRVGAQLCARWFFGRESRIEAVGLQETLDAFVTALTAFPIRSSHSRYGRGLRARDLLRALLEEAAVGRQGSSAAGPFLEAVITARAPDGSRLEGTVLRDEALHLLFAAYTGVYDALLLLLWDLARNPEARNRAAAEARTKLRRCGSLDHRELARLTYLNALCREVRRINRINPATFFATVTSAFQLSGYSVPAGWRAVAAIYTTMNHEGVFTRPRSFEPDRFLPGRAEHRRHDDSYVAHGGGSIEGHRCAGEDLISAVMMTTGAMLLRDGHDWEIVEGQDLRLSREVFPLPRSGLRVRFRRGKGESHDGTLAAR